MKGTSGTIETENTFEVIEVNIYPTWQSLWRQSKMQLELVITSKNESNCSNEVDDSSTPNPDVPNEKWTCGTYSTRKRIGKFYFHL